MVADQHLLGDQPREPRDRAGEALPGAVAGPGEHALDVLRLVGVVPLDGEVARRDRLGQARELARDQILEPALRLRIVAREVGLERVQRARGERQPDLEAQPGRDHALVAKAREDRVGLDRVVDPRPRVPVQLVDPLAHREHRRLVRMPRDAGRRRGLLDDDDVRVGPGELLALVSHPRRARAGLAVRQGEDEVGEVARAGAERGLGGVGRQAADQQEVAGHPGRHACTARVCGPRKEMFGWNGISWSGGARRRPGKRRVSSSSASVASRRPSAEPMQKWMPRPNASVRREFGALGVEGVRVGEDLGVAAGGGEPEEQLRALGQVDAAERSPAAWSRAATPARTGRSAGSRPPRRGSGPGARPAAPSARGPRAAAGRSCRSGCSSSRARRS